MADVAWYHLLSRPELLPANDAIRNGIVFEAIASHPASKCGRCYHSWCEGPGIGRCGRCSMRCIPYRCLMGVSRHV